MLMILVVLGPVLKVMLYKLTTRNIGSFVVNNSSEPCNVSFTQMYNRIPDNSDAIAKEIPNKYLVFL